MLRASSLHNLLIMLSLAGVFWGMPWTVAVFSGFVLVELSRNIGLVGALLAPSLVVLGSSLFCGLFDAPVCMVLIPGDDVGIKFGGCIPEFS